MLLPWHWKEAVETMKFSTNEENHFEIYSKLLIHCLKSQQYVKLQDLFDFTPKSMSVYDIMKIVSTYVPKDRTNVMVSSENDFSVEILRNLLLRVIPNK